ncbi:hypothetical protein GCM10027605_03660 [Micromonospora zhanjiangensis]
MTNPVRLGTLDPMNATVQRPDPDRSRRRLQLLAELAGAKAFRGREYPRWARDHRLRDRIADRRRLAN